MIFDNKKNTNIKIYFDKEYFLVGEYIKGNIEIQVNSKTILSGILIEIFLTESWRIKDGENNNSDYYKKKIVTYNLDLKKLGNFKSIDNDILLSNGLNFIPFNFRFSEENIPSFEYPLPEKRAFIRYDFNVTINSPYLKGNTSSFLCLMSRPFLDSEKLLSKSSKQHIKKWKIFDKGETILKISFPENNYKYNSTCKLNIEIDNIKGKTTTKEYKVMLIRKINYKNNTTGEIKFKDEINIVSERIKAKVEPGNKKNFEYNLIFKENNPNKKYNYNLEINPYNIDINEINSLMPTVNGKIISCEYEIKISLYFQCFVAYKDRPRVIIPVYLVHQLPMDYQLEIQEQIDFENALKNSTIQDNIFIFNDSDKKENDLQKNYINDSNLVNNNIKDNYKKDNYYIEENEEDNELPSLEAIKEAQKNQMKEIKNKNNLDENKIEVKNELEENKINIDSYNNVGDDSCPPCVYDNAPSFFEIKEENKTNSINNYYYDINKNNNINNDENNKNINKINKISESPEDFSLFNFNNRKNSKQKDSNQNKFENINEI